MASGLTGDLGRHLGRLFGAGGTMGLTDSELLERFAHCRDEAAEAAFETLLARHGAMVLTVCRQVLGDAHAAEDAFQATFMVLVRRAGSLRVRAPGSLGPWLYGVAYRIALKARQRAARRRAREHRAAVPAVAGSSVAIEPGELRALLHEEVNRLPAKYRTPVVLCYFEGRTHEEAATALQWPVGTVRGRLARARDLLRSRLTRRDVALGEGVGASLLEPISRIEPPARLLAATVAALKETPTAAVAAMANLMLRGQLTARFEMFAAILSVVLITTGFGLALRGKPASQPGRRPDPSSTEVALAPPRTKPRDRSGEPLPEHARARLGSTRFNHGTSVIQALYTPDGKSLVAIDRIGGVRVWDSSSGRMVRAIGEPTTHFRRIALSPDGRTLATIEDPGRLRTWDLASGRESRRWHAIPGTYQHLTFSPDGRTVAAGLSTSDRATRKQEKAINLWDLTSPTEHRRRLVDTWLSLEGLVFSPDGKTLVSGSNDTESLVAGRKLVKGSTRLWDVATGRERARFPVEGSYVRSIAISPNGRLLAASLTDETIRLYDLTSGQERVLCLGRDDELRLKSQAGDAEAVRVGHSPAVMSCLAISPDGSILAASSNGTGTTGLSSRADVFLWDIAQGKKLRHFPAQQSWITSLTFSPDGRTLATTGPAPMVRLWDVTSGREAFPQPGHRSRVLSLVISPADGTVFTGGEDGAIRHWDPASGRELGVIARFANPPDALAIAPDGQTLLVGGSQGGRFALWSIAERREIRSFPRISPDRLVRYVTFSPDGKTVASERRVWDTASGRVLVTCRDRDRQMILAANFSPIFYSPDGTQLITSERQGARIWDIASGQEMRWAVQVKIHYDRVALSHDGRYLAVGGLVSRVQAQGGENDPPIRLWELSSGQEVATLENHESGTRALAFSQGGRFLVSGSETYSSASDATVRVWGAASGRELRRFEGHLASVNAVAITPDGCSVVSASEDATALVWDISDLTEGEAAARPLAVEELRTRWDELAGEDARAAYRATWALSVPSAVAFLREHLRPAAHPDPKGIPAVNGPIAPPEVLRTLRAMAALERVGTPQARAVLEQMARGNLDAIETRDAKSALDRLNRRAVIRAGSSIR